MKYYFLHIPKTGGASLNHILRQNFAASKMLSLKGGNRKETVEYLKNLSEKKRKKIKIVYGYMHFPFGIHKLINSKGENFKYFSIMRNPIQRVISHYEYAKRSPAHYLFHKIKNENISLYDYVNEICHEVSNGQAIQISGLFMNNFYEFDENQYINEFNETELYNKAVSNIEKHFCFFGIMEDFNKTIELMQKYLKLRKLLCHYKIRNTSKKNHNEFYKIPDKVMELIQNKNKVDIKLYNYCKKRFQNLYKKLIDDIDKEDYSENSFFINSLIYFSKKINNFI
jgi:hypothetical protein